MAAYGIAIRDTASGELERLRAALDQRGYADALGEAGKLVLMDHFSKRENDPSSHRSARRLGARPVGLFAEFARATSWQRSSSGVVLSVEHAAIRQRLEGGEIRPINSKALTLPANAAAYGKRARDFALVAVYFRDPKENLIGMLIAPQDIVEQRRRTRKGKAKTVDVVTQRAGVYFWMVGAVTQNADPTVLPTDKEFLDGATEALDGYIGGLSGG